MISSSRDCCGFSVAARLNWPAGWLPAVGVTFTGSGGTVIAAGTELARADGVNYITDAEVSIDGGSAIAAVTAVAAGETANAVAATQLSLVSPIAGIDSIATVDGAALTGGSDEEVDQTLLERVLERIQEPPHGGAEFDYPTWAREVSGVTRAWVYAQELGLGTVTVRFMMDDTYADGIPVAGDVTTVQDYIDTYRPVTADVTVVAPVAVPLAFDISGLDPATAEVKAAITAELADLIRREGEQGGSILLSHIREAISIAAGETDHAVVAPAADVNHATGEIATMGAIAWS